MKKSWKNRGPSPPPKMLGSMRDVHLWQPPPEQEYWQKTRPDMVLHLGWKKEHARNLVILKRSHGPLAKIHPKKRTYPCTDAEELVAAALCSPTTKEQQVVTFLGSQVSSVGAERPHKHMRIIQAMISGIPPKSLKLSGWLGSALLPARLACHQDVAPAPA